MGLFDKIADATKKGADAVLASVSNKKVQFVFNEMPETLSDFTALPEFKRSTPFEAAALLVIALCNYAANKEVGIDMLNAIRGPEPLNNHEKSFLKDRINGSEYLPVSYFKGTSPSNNYTPTKPYTLEVEDNKYSYDNEGYATLWLKSSGADSPRQVTLRRKGDTWCYYDNHLLPGIRKPDSQDLWK